MSESKRWAREYSCGCREVIPDDEMTSIADHCERHPEARPVVVGYLLPEADVTDLQERAEATERMLRELEWSVPEEDLPFPTGPRCPSCFGWRDGDAYYATRGHKPDCALDALLRSLPEPGEVKT